MKHLKLERSCLLISYATFLSVEIIVILWYLIYCDSRDHGGNILVWLQVWMSTVCWNTRRWCSPCQL